MLNPFASVVPSISTRATGPSCTVQVTACRGMPLPYRSSTRAVRACPEAWFSGRVTAAPSNTAIPQTGPGSARAVKNVAGDGASSTVTSTFPVPATVSSVHPATANPSASVVLASGDRLPAGVCQWTIAPALGSPSKVTCTWSGSGSAVPTIPLWPLVGGTGVARTTGARPVALKDTGEPAAPATVVVAVMVPISGPSVQVADASPAASLTVCAGRMVPAETAQSTVTPALGAPSDFDPHAERQRQRGTDYSDLAIRGVDRGNLQSGRRRTGRSTPAARRPRRRLPPRRGTCCGASGYGRSGGRATYALLVGVAAGANGLMWSPCSDSTFLPSPSCLHAVISSIHAVSAAHS